ncbi:UNVERIFIED_CONTAM: hypothetical protein PYX00_006978 [Menopon gallinae]|uniref:Uncharacterized protein n=1 Tax=Menopon gallinae TaxID=328185 RepID=A0AAW2HHD3_9NEOP
MDAFETVKKEKADSPVDGEKSFIRNQDGSVNVERENCSDVEKTSQQKKVKTITVPCEIKMYFEDLAKSETVIKSVPNPAWKEAASQLERGKTFFLCHAFT